MVKLSSFNFHLVIKSSNMSYTLYFLTFSILFVQILALFFLCVPCGRYVSVLCEWSCIYIKGARKLVLWFFAVFIQFSLFWGFNLVKFCKEFCFTASALH